MVKLELERNTNNVPGTAELCPQPDIEDTEGQEVVAETKDEPRAVQESLQREHALEHGTEDLGLPLRRSEPIEDVGLNVRKKVLQNDGVLLGVEVVREKRERVRARNGDAIDWDGRFISR